MVVEDPGPADPTPALARGELNKAAILSIALDLVDERGLEAVTMRRIADAAGLTPMSLYRHVRTKEEILIGLGELAWDLLAYNPPDDPPWDELLLESFKHMHRMLLDHPGVLDILLVMPGSSLAAYRMLDRLMGALNGAGFSCDAAFLAVLTLENYTLGFAIQQRTRVRRDHAGKTIVQPELPADEFPNLDGAATTLTEWASDDWFWAGLRRQIDSLSRESLTPN
jgi:TetR/AcrR family tetracycline transcriptional repressor